MEERTVEMMNEEIVESNEEEFDRADDAVESVSHGNVAGAAALVGIGIAAGYALATGGFIGKVVVPFVRRKLSERKAKRKTAKEEKKSSDVVVDTDFTEVKDETEDSDNK